MWCVLNVPNWPVPWCRLRWRPRWWGQGATQTFLTDPMRSPSVCRNTHLSLLLSYHHSITNTYCVMLQLSGPPWNKVLTVQLSYYYGYMNTVYMIATHTNLEARRTMSMTEMVTKAARNRKRKRSVRGRTSAWTAAMNNSRKRQQRRELPNPTSISSWYCGEDR